MNRRIQRADNDRLEALGGQEMTTAAKMSTLIAELHSILAERRKAERPRKAIIDNRHREIRGALLRLHTQQDHAA